MTVIAKNVIFPRTLGILFQMLVDLVFCFNSWYFSCL